MGRKKKAQFRETIKDQLAAKGFDPLSQLVNLLESRIPIREEQLNDPVITLLCAQDWSIEPLTVPINGKTHCLVPRLKVRIDAARDLLGFVYPRLRSTATKVDNQSSLNISIVYFGENKERAIELAPRAQPAIEPGEAVVIDDTIPCR